jgi:hypothetical protein
MWGRRQGTQTTGLAAKDTAVADRTRALTAPGDLLRRAEWETLAEADRTALLAPYQGHTPPAFRADGAAPERDAALRLQDWVAALVATRFQPEAAGVVRTWLDDAPPDAHLYLGGRPGQGRTSLVASLARATLAKRPAPPDYCYLPDATTLDKPALLVLPSGTGADFVKALGPALGAICQGWSGEGGGDGDSNGSGSGTGDGGSKPAAAAPPPDRKQLVAQQLDPLSQNAPDAARGYLAQLRASLVTLAGGDDAPPFCSGDVPVTHVRAGSDAAAGAIAASTGAPVIVASLAQTELSEALLRANGGVLVLAAPDVMDSSTWGTLAAALKARALPIKDGWPPLPLAVRVVLVGNGDQYQALYSGTDDFARLFRSEVWCNWSADWTRETEAAYAALAGGVCARYDLPPFDAAGVARLVQEGARRADILLRTNVSTNVQALHDIAVEAGCAAKAHSAAATTGIDVEAALQRRRTLQSGVARHVRESILTGEEMTPTSGAAIGQVNGLGIYDVHPVEGTFAVPIRISATASLAREEQLVDIERVSDQADADHIRGEMTMEGYLANRYGQDRPINVAVRIRFEQEHGATGGDSGSAAALFALLSALALVPLRCSLAVTGAVGQYGEIQPIGGVNTKIEGFWEICRARRAQGEQAPDGGYGVLIPAVNARDLMLRPDVTDSIAGEGWFHVWPISTVDEGLALLTGLPAEAVHARVERRLKRFHELALRNRISG